MVSRRAGCSRLGRMYLVLISSPLAMFLWALTSITFVSGWMVYMVLQ